MPLAILSLQIYKNPYIASVVMCIVAVIAFYARLVIAGRQIFLDKKTYLGSLLKTVLPSVVVILPVEYYIMNLLPKGGLSLFIVRMSVSFLICIVVIWLLGTSSAERNKILSFARNKLHL